VFNDYSEPEYSQIDMSSQPFKPSMQVGYLGTSELPYDFITCSIKNTCDIDPNKMRDFIELDLAIETVVDGETSGIVIPFDTFCSFSDF